MAYNPGSYLLPLTLLSAASRGGYSLFSEELGQLELLLECLNECVNVLTCYCVSPWRIKDSRIYELTH